MDPRVVSHMADDFSVLLSPGSLPHSETTPLQRVAFELPPVVDGLDLAAAAGVDLPHAVHDYALLREQRERKTRIV